MDSSDINLDNIKQNNSVIQNRLNQSELFGINLAIFISLEIVT